jgi:hypothetical protein
MVHLDPAAAFAKVGVCAFRRADRFLSGECGGDGAVCGDLRGVPVSVAAHCFGVLLPAFRGASAFGVLLATFGGSVAKPAAGAVQRQVGLPLGKLPFAITDAADTVQPVRP